MPTTQLFDLSGRVALVTGGNGGIGRSIATGLAKAGAAVAVLARNEEKNRHVMGELQALGVRALAVRVDVTERGRLQPAMEKVEDRFHGNRLDLAFLEPPAQSNQIGGKYFEPAHRPWIPIFRHGHPIGIGSNIESGRIEVHLLQKSFFSK
jgi:NAD(P)-dependent dehydrogenase (short-subunit alcohol dehydrogenase family)